MAELTKKELEAKVAELEARLANSGEQGKIWPDVSKAVKNGEKPTSIMVLRGVHAKPQNTINMYPAQWARMLPQIPDICKAMLVEKLWTKFSFRSDEEKRNTKAVLEAYIEESR